MQCDHAKLALGSSVQVKWSKREVYSARIIGFTTVPQYLVSCVPLAKIKVLNAFFFGSGDAR